MCLDAMFLSFAIFLRGKNPVSAAASVGLLVKAQQVQATFSAA
jgi:hypothetical protein